MAPLKHCRPDEVRYIYLDDEPELVAVLRGHLDRFVPPTDPDADDPDERDPYVLTIHTGAHVALGKFGSR